VIILNEFTIIIAWTFHLQVNNAGINGFNTDDMVEPIINWRELSQTYEMAENCIITNYYGGKETTEAFLPLLQLSDSPVIVNVSSTAGLLKVRK